MTVTGSHCPFGSPTRAITATRYTSRARIHARGAVPGARRHRLAINGARAPRSGGVSRPAHRRLRPWARGRFLVRGRPRPSRSASSSRAWRSASRSGPLWSAVRPPSYPSTAMLMVALPGREGTDELDTLRGRSRLAPSFAPSPSRPTPSPGWPPPSASPGTPTSILAQANARAEEGSAQATITARYRDPALAAAIANGLAADLIERSGGTDARGAGRPRSRPAVRDGREPGGPARDGARRRGRARRGRRRARRPGRGPPARGPDLSTRRPPPRGRPEAPGRPARPTPACASATWCWGRPRGGASSR